jgi:N-acetylmuramoyl-L-alanine amidase
MRKITEIIVHCTATRPDWWAGKRTSDKVREIKRWHVQDRGWSDIGYHFLIDRDGTVAKGRDMARDGAHVQGKNKGTIGISLFGGHGSAETDQFGDHFTPEQDVALRNLIGDLQKQFGLVPVSGHNQYAAKACPGFNAPAWFARKPAPRPAAPAVAPSRPGMGNPVTKAQPGLLAALWRALVAWMGKK